MNIKEKVILQGDHAASVPIRSDGTLSGWLLGPTKAAVLNHLRTDGVNRFLVYALQNLSSSYSEAGRLGITASA